jgi:hypothetical protein
MRIILFFIHSHDHYVRQEIWGEASGGQSFGGHFSTPILNRMKKQFLALLFVLSILFVHRAHAQADLSIGNISAGYDTYSTSTTLLSGIYFTMLNNTNTAATSFTVTVYLLDANDYNNAYILSQFTRNGQGGNSAVDVTNLNVRLDTVSGLPTGSYRVNVFIDSNNDVSETDENNNRLFITTQGNNIDYTATTTAIEAAMPQDAYFQVLGNPIRAGNLNVQIPASLEATRLDVMAINGQMVQSIPLSVVGATTTQQKQLNLHTAPGIYLVRLHTAYGFLTRRFEVQD